MDYDTIAIRATVPARKQKAKAAAPQRRTFPALDAAQKGHRRGACRPPAVRPCNAAAYSFLKTRFLPHFAGQAVAGDPYEEGCFYRSLALLCDHYAIAPTATQSLSYPYGREVARYEVERLLREACPCSISVDFEENGGDFVLTVTETFSTQNTLFFIPVAPLHRLIGDRKTRKPARLLLCIFSYLYNVAGIPFYTDDSTYLCWNYDMLSEWVLDDPEGWDAEDYAPMVSEIRIAEHIGQEMMRRLWNPIHLNCFREWLTAFAPKDAFEKECASLAMKFYGLWRDYPKAHIYGHADTDCLHHPEGYDDTGCITMDKYIGFVASTTGWLYNNLEQYVNADFNECCEIQEPVLKRFFDGRMQENESLDFECRLFPLINELCYLLNNLDNDT